MHLIEKVNHLDTSAAPSPRQVSAAQIAPRLTASVFSIDHRGELVKEMRADADELDRRAGELQHQAAQHIALALSLRLSADHLEANPPE